MEITQLKYGPHTNPEDGMCFMEAVAFVAGEPHSDNPRCADFILAAFGRLLNDTLNDSERELLLPLVPKLVGTAGSEELSRRRMFIIVDGVIRTILPLVFDAELPEIAASLRALKPIADKETAEAAQFAADAAYGAARDAARDASHAADSAAYAAYVASHAAYRAAKAARSAAYNAVDIAAGTAGASSVSSVASAADIVYHATDSADRSEVALKTVEIFSAAIGVQP